MPRILPDNCPKIFSQIWGHVLPRLPRLIRLWLAAVFGTGDCNDGDGDCVQARIKHLVQPQDTGSRTARRHRSVGFLGLMERRANRQMSQVDVWCSSFGRPFISVHANGPSCLLCAVNLRIEATGRSVNSIRVRCEWDSFVIAVSQIFVVSVCRRSALFLRSL